MHRTIIRILVAVATIAATTTPLIAQMNERAAALESIIAAERSFAAMARERGVDSAFYLNVADDGVLFRPTLVRGKEWLRANMRPKGKALLLWDPMWADVSASRDFGYTTGPYEVRSGDGASDSVLARGSFVTVWRRQHGGAWRYLIDLGSGGTAPLVAGGRVMSPPSAANAPHRNDDASARAMVRDSVLALDRAVGASGSAHDLHARLAPLLTHESRLLRPGVAPSIGAAQLAMATPDSGHYASSPLGGEVASSADLAFTYGTWERGNRKGPYQRIWKRDATGEWRLAMDVEGR